MYVWRLEDNISPALLQIISNLLRQQRTPGLAGWMKTLPLVLVQMHNAQQLHAMHHIHAQLCTTNLHNAKDNTWFICIVQVCCGIMHLCTIFQFMYNTRTTNCAYLFKKRKIYAQVHNSKMLCIKWVLCIAQLCIMTNSIEHCSYLCCSACKFWNRALFWAICTNTTYHWKLCSLVSTLWLLLDVNPKTRFWDIQKFHRPQTKKKLFKKKFWVILS